MNPIGSFSGLASGIQWRDLVDQIVKTDQARRVNPISTQVGLERRRMDAWNTFKGLVTKLEDATRKLRDGSAFQNFNASGGTSAVSGRALVTATASTSAAVGTYSVEVQQLARAEKLGSSGYPDPTAPLGVAGSFSINGRSVDLDAADTLNGIRDKINAANTGANPSGVTASILSIGPGESRLVLTAASTGAAGIRLEEGAGQPLSQLGIGTTSRSVEMRGTTAEPAPVLSSVLGLSSPPAVRTIVIDGREVTVDLTRDTLQDLYNRIRNAASNDGADPDAAARLVTEGDAVRLEVQGTVTGRVDDADTRQVLAALGFARQGLATAGTNAAARVDGFDISRRTNTVADVIPGVTLSLQQVEPGTAVDVSVARDKQKTIDAVKEFATAYNDLAKFVADQRGEGKPLAANSSLRSTLASFTDVLLTPTTGLDTPLDRSTLAGLSLSRTGELQVDEARVSALLDSEPESLRALFTGVRTDGTLVPGLATRMMTAAAQASRFGDGTIAIQVDSLTRSVEALERRKTAAEGRLEQRRESLTKQFIRMEEAMAKLQAQGSWLSAQVQSMQASRR